MKDLIERLEAATGAFVGGERSDLSRDLSEALGGYRSGGIVQAWAYAALGDGIEAIGASLALVGEKLPGSMWRVGFDPDDQSMKAEIVTDAPECRHAVANHDTPALAVLLALLRALETK